MLKNLKSGIFRTFFHFYFRLRKRAKKSTVLFRNYKQNLT